jgi:hypothetical protein
MTAATPTARLTKTMDVHPHGLSFPPCHQQIRGLDIAMDDALLERVLNGFTHGDQQGVKRFDPVPATPIIQNVA